MTDWATRRGCSRRKARLLLIQGEGKERRGVPSPTKGSEEIVCGETGLKEWIHAHGNSREEVPSTERKKKGPPTRLVKNWGLRRGRVMGAHSVS